MKIRTKADFENRMDEESGWRIQELAHIRKMAGRAQDGTPSSRVILRTGHTLLYAHWEGWVKNVGHFYLEFIKGTRVLTKDLTDPLAGSALLSELRKYYDSSKSENVSELARFVLSTAPGLRARFHAATIDTGSNLTYALFKDILMKLGLDEKKYATKQNLISTQLVHTRNTVAHGEHTRVHGDRKVDGDDRPITLSSEGYIELHDQVVGLLQDFHADVLEAVRKDSHLR